MAIKNYTTQKHPLESIGEIQAALAKGGAKKVMIDYDDNGEPKGLAFAIETERGMMGFQLPANIEGVYKVFQKQKVKADMKQALQEAFLPYLTDRSGNTLYHAYISGQLMLAE